jgi:hypothetical protein
MSDLYTSLQVSPRKKRALPDSDDDEFTVTPKRLRTTFVHLHILLSAEPD